MIPVKEKYIIDEKGKTVNILLTKKDYDRLVEYIEDLEDIAAYDKTKKLKGKNIDWEKIKR